MRKLLITLALVLSLPMSGLCSSINYYDLDFEDGSLGGGGVSGPWDLPTNIVSSNLDGKALQFLSDDEIKWDRNNVDFNFHTVSFDYDAEDGSNVTLFLDMPNILRVDFDAVGRHHVEVHFDFTTREVLPYLDGTLDLSLITALGWPTDSPSASDIRIANQFANPGNSTKNFQIDNLVWSGSNVPEPTTAILLGFGLLGLAGVSRRKA